MVKEIKVEFTDQKVTAWGGMKLMKDMLDNIGIKEFMSGLDLPEKGSNRGYEPIQIMECFWTSIWIGAGRFSHSAYLRYDKVLQEIFGWKQAPSQSTYSRFFQKFSWKRNDEVFVPVQKWFIDNLKIKNITIDFDSSVMTRYGEQEGSKVGYNSHKPGRPSHHPLMAFVAETRMVANAWLRPGNTGALSNCKAFIDETFEILKDKKVGLIRADSGFYSHDFLKYLEFEKRTNYIIAVKMYPNIKQELRSLKSWTKLKDGMEIAEFEYQSPDWKQPRRMVAVRKNIEILTKATGKLLLFDEPVGKYRYSLYVTNLDLPAEQIWLSYKDRADAENRIKELKYDFGLDTFCMDKFWATEAAFRTIMIAYNMMSLFRQVVLQTKTQATLSTLRFKCFALGSWISKHAGKTTLKVSAIGEKRKWLDGLFDTVSQNDKSFYFPNA
ncbi:MAG TPA: IS1380 family transposase [Nitrosopumilaceae archaeon]|nr:IS1380 family transposase [Nitrosopumilaceae archaeon]